MFTHDQLAARAEMTVRGIYDFEHVGTQAPNNGEQNKREAHLGCYHAHKLFEGIKVELKPGKTYPESFDDYKDKITCAWTENTLPKGVVLHLRHEQPVTSIKVSVMTETRSQERFSQDDLIPISSIADLVFCERRAALHFLEGTWEENQFTAEGHILHDKTHEVDCEMRKEVRIVRGLRLRSLKLGLSGVADVVEFRRLGVSPSTAS